MAVGGLGSFKWARSKTRSSRKTRKPLRISFPRFSTQSFPFCIIPKTDKSELKTSEICSEVVSSNSEPEVLWSNSEVSNSDFPFCTTLKTENSEMKTSEFSPTPSDQTPRFSISEFSVLSVVQNGQLGVGKPRSLIKQLNKSLFW